MDLKTLPVALLLLVVSAAAGCSGAYMHPRIFDCSGEKLRFDDGDSIYCDGEYIRIMGLDTPETIHKEHGFFVNQPFGPEASALAEKVLGEAHRITVIDAGRDHYGRTLGHVLVDGALFAVKMIEAGLAYETITEYGDHGFRGFAALIVEAAGRAPELRFRNPHDWRRANRRETKGGD